MIEIKFAAGKQAIDAFQKALVKMERERLRQIGGAMRPVLREAVAHGRALLSVLFGGRGKRFQRAFVSQIRFRGDDLEARLGYVKPTGKGGARFFWWLGRIWEYGATITSKKGRLWVPIGANRYANGRPVVSARQFFSEFQGRSVVKKTEAGNRVVFAAQDGQLMPMFVLKSSVAFKARPAVTPTAEKFLPKITEAAGQALFNNFKRKV